MKEEICEDGLEHEITDCPNCNYQFCTSCGLGEDDSQSKKKENKR